MHWLIDSYSKNAHKTQGYQRKNEKPLCTANRLRMSHPTNEPNYYFDSGESPADFEASDMVASDLAFLASSSSFVGLRPQTRRLYPY